MQKKLIALAIAGLSGAAFAQSNVTISGVVTGTYSNYKIGSLNTSIRGATATTNTQHRIDDQSSKFVLSGSEDLGNGLKAVFQIDNRFYTDVGGSSAASGTGTVGAGNTFFGLAGNWGQLVMGRNDVHYHTLIEAGVERPAGGTLQGLHGMGVLNQVGGQAIGGRLGNALQYDSPNLNGFKGRVVLTTSSLSGANAGAGAQEGAGVGSNAAGNSSNPGAGYGYNLVGFYNNGPINLVLSYINVQAEGRTGANQPLDAIGTRLGGAYDFPMGLKVGLVWDRSTIKNMTSITNTAAGVIAYNTAAAGAAASDLTRTAWSLPISYTTGAHSVSFTYTKLGNLSGTTGASTGGKASTLGYSYALSKRTSLGATWTRVANDDATGATISNTGGVARGAYNMFAAGVGTSAPIAGESNTLVSLGLTHAF